MGWGGGGVLVLVCVVVYCLFPCGGEGMGGGCALCATNARGNCNSSINNTLCTHTHTHTCLHTLIFLLSPPRYNTVDVPRCASIQTPPHQHHPCNLCCLPPRPHPCDLRLHRIRHAMHAALCSKAPSDHPPGGMVPCFCQSAGAANAGRADSDAAHATAANAGGVDRSNTWEPQYINTSYLTPDLIPPIPLNLHPPIPLNLTPDIPHHACTACM